SPADELHKLNELREKGALSQEEFDQAKAKLLT
ncbi:MAG: SHOCT domain-containing protein, partial [Actinobacteria bacterium]|nr:SHOCT domain-containing protein [Actinomycetota bacterium]